MNKPVSKKSGKVLDYKKARIKRAVMQLKNAPYMQPQELNECIYNGIIAPICEELENLYGPRLHELTEVKQKLNTINTLLLCLLQNQARLHYMRVYKPMVDVRKQEIIDSESKQLQLLDPRAYDCTPTVEPIIPIQPVVSKNSTTQLRGVRSNKGKYIPHVWDESLKRQGRKSAQQTLGSYPDPVFAALVRDAAAFDLHGNKAKLNFPIMDA